MNLVPITSPVLWSPAQPVEAGDIATWALSIKKMQELMAKHNGACLSAPQVGIPRRFFVTKYGNFTVCLNPHWWPSAPADEIIFCSKPEGSPSKPGWSQYVRRCTAITVKFTDEDGKPVSLPLEDIEARVFLHACDYLDGRPPFPAPAGKNFTTITA